MKRDNTDKEAIRIIREYVGVNCNVDITWKCKTMKHYKYLLTAEIDYDYSYYELTYNADDLEWQLDIYKWYNRVTTKEISK